MPRAHTPSRHLIGNRVASAKSRTEKVQEDIQLAEAELHLASKVITDKLAQKATDADLAKAVAHTDQIEEKLRDAGDELKAVTELLTSEERDRERLEQSLRELRASDGASLAGSRSGEGSASVIDHLRELTRHKLNSDHAAQPARDAGTPGKA
jgi:predicted  nucleic acid-binding Zn-ribbon protein